MATLKIKNGTVWQPVLAIKGDTGEQGNPGEALPLGGTAGQIIIKNSSVDDDASWYDNPNHDDRYYTETETDTLLSGKANVTHGHAISDVTGLQSALDGKVDDSQVLTNVPAGAVFTDTVYTHPATHSISEVSGLQTALDGKAPLASPTFTGTPTLSGAGRMIADSSSTGTDIYFIWSGTQAQYDAIGTKDANTLYFIV